MTSPDTDDQLIRLASDNARMYQDAERWFLDRGAAVAPALVEGLDNLSLGSVGRWRILLVLRALHLPETLPAILKAFRGALADRDPIVLPGAMEALAVFAAADAGGKDANAKGAGAEDALSALISVLDSGHPDFINHAAVLIGKNGGPRAQEALAALLRHPDPLHRQSAVRGLLQMDTASARDLLTQHRAQEQDRGVLKLLKGVR
jgi:HEAT repeat protein